MTPASTTANDDVIDYVKARHLTTEDHTQRVEAEELPLLADR